MVLEPPVPQPRQQQPLTEADKKKLKMRIDYINTALVSNIKASEWSPHHQRMMAKRISSSKLHLQLQQFLHHFQNKAALAVWFQKIPVILHMQVATVQSKLDNCSRLLGVPPEKAVKVATKCPRILTFSTQTLTCKVQQLQSLCWKDADGLRHMLQRHPKLLTYSPLTMREKYKQLATIFDISPQCWARMIRCKPTLLLLSPQYIKDQLSALARVLQKGSPFVQEMAVAQPTMIYLHTDLVARKHKLLLHAANLRPSWVHQAASMDAQELAYCLIRSQKVLSRPIFLAEKTTLRNNIALSTILHASEADWQQRMGDMYDAWCRESCDSLNLTPVQTAP